MTQPGLIDRLGLLNWADSIGARSELPRLIRRLILETGKGVVELGFPAGEGVSAASWDGTVRASEDAPYVPAGLSLWELSVEKSPGAKADDDYAKRTSTPDASPTTDAIYVAVSLRPWLKRGEWAQGKSGDGRWKGVRALGVDDVETWLESAPITRSWLSETVGLKPHGLVTAETWWERWSAATTPPFPSAAVVAGRDEEVAALRAALSPPGRLLTVRGSSRDEVAAFVASLALSEESTDAGALLARTAFVDDVEAWRRLREHPTPLVLVALTEAVVAEFAAGSTHVLVVPLTGTTDADVELSSIDSLVAAQVLKDAGLPERQADDAGKLARLSLLAARRRLANKRELHRPAWGESPASKSVRRVVLVGRWHENSDGDRRLLEQVTGISYDDLREEIATVAAGGDPLLARIGGAIGVVSHLDAFLVLRGELRTDDLETLHEAVRTVFAETDPRLELPHEDRWRASLLGKQRLYSFDLRQGLGTTLALLGAHGDRPMDGAGMAGRDWAGWMVRELLERANADSSCLLWTSLADVLPLLAEAAPSQFLEAVRVGATGASPILRGIFGDAGSGDSFSTDSAHSSLLWAMEVCAWSPNHFGLVVDLLARLAEIDPGGRLANRPFASLQAILLPWFPQNSVTPERRLSAIDGLREHHEPLAWRLLLSLLPEMHGVSGHISEPQFRDWKPEKIAVSRPEYWNFIDELYNRILEDVEHDPDRWVVLIDKIDDVPPASRAATLARLDGISEAKSLTDEQRAAIWEALREKVARHREFPDAQWALPESEVAAIERTVAKFEPSTTLARVAWLFKNQRPEIPEVARGDNYHEYEAALARLRAEASAEIADATGWEEILAFAMTLDVPWFLGEALAQAERFEHEAELLRLLESENNAEVTFAAGYAWKRFRDARWEWLDACLARGELAAIQLGRLLLYTHDFPKAWEVADAQGDAVARAFWMNFRNQGLGGDFEYVNLVAERLLGVDRPAAALDLIALYSRLEQDEKLDSERAELVVRGLEAILEHGDAASEVRALSRYELMGLVRALERSDLPRERVAALEWAYLPAFGIDSSPVALSEMLSRDPNFFVDLIRRMYRPRRDGGDDDTGDAEQEEAADEEQRAAFATNAYRLLSDWKTVPGLRDDGSVDAATLGAWVTDARAKLEESGHLEIGDSHIGRVFAHGPPDPGGARPCEPIRALLEKLQSPAIEDGLRVELYNSRGPTSRGVFDGGDQERIVAAAYAEQAETFADRWPRTASVLRDLAESYEREARRLDEEAERRRKGFEA
jgi:hypothetical protein